MNSAVRLQFIVVALGVTGFARTWLSSVNAWRSTLIVTAIHVIFGTGLVVGLFFLLTELVRKEHPKPLLRFRSSLIAFLVFGAILTGGFLAVSKHRGPLPLAHAFLGVALLLVAEDTRSQRRLSGRFLWLTAMSLLVVTFVDRERRHVSQVVHTFSPASMRVLGEMPPYNESRMGAKRCEYCHAIEVAQWKESLHSVADTELVYARVVADFRRRFGAEGSKWCAGCHSPLRLARDELNVSVARVEESSIGCAACHSVRRLHQPIGNNGYDMMIEAPADYERVSTARFANWLLFLVPDQHRQRWNREVVEHSDFCGACHRQVLPQFIAGLSGILLQDTFGEWQKSSYNSANQSTRRTCQDCHMLRSGSAQSPRGQGVSHYFPGGTVDVSRVLGARKLHSAQKALLSTSARLSAVAMARQTRTEIGLTVTVSNVGAGHNLPTGVSDLRQLWLQVRALDDQGTVVYESGRVDESGLVDPSAVRFGVVLGDVTGHPVRLHDIARARSVLIDTSIPPGGTRSVNYVFPTLSTKTLTINVNLLYQALPQDFVSVYISPELRFESTAIATVSTTINLADEAGKKGSPLN